jgi:hypothetical protein
MQAAKNYILDSTQQICDLYRDNVNIDEAVESMQGRNISAEFITSIYTQLSNEVDKFATKRFHYYDYDNDTNAYNRVSCWTSRYLLVYNTELSESTFHEIKIIDLFNDKSV